MESCWLSLEMQDGVEVKTQGSLFALPHIWFSFGIYTFGHVARFDVVMWR